MINPVKMLIRSQLSLANKFIMPNLSIEATRQAQGYLGSLMSTLHLLDVTFEDFKIGSLDACFITPHREYPSGIILYLHGGGYTFGDINYSKGFASMLSHKCGIKVMSVAYRLAPENQFPCALDDCLSAYEYLLSVGYKPEQIVLFGESAGGGLCFSLCFCQSTGENGGAPPPSKNHGACRPNAFMHLRQPLFITPTARRTPALP